MGATDGLHEMVQNNPAQAGAVILAGAATAAAVGYWMGRRNAPGMKAGGSAFSKTNSDTSGARFEKDLPVGKHDLQLYSMATPNGQKVTLMLEELGVPYDAHFIGIWGDQFGSGFVKGNPNSKIPLLIDHKPLFQDEPIAIFESCHILQYLAEKYNSPLLPRDGAARAEVNNWLFFQHGTGPFFGQFGHFYRYAPFKIPYCVDRYKTELRRILDVIDKQLAGKEYLCKHGCSIADLALYPWVCCITAYYNAGDFVRLHEFKNVVAWMKRCGERPSVTLGMKINSSAPDNAKWKDWSSAGRAGGVH
mmetsp:Transcript_23930/g.59085  ORF Transcript_23930/g.59085 Transcript_23930/m.59085 type:complete len:305 (-) Transcript_23930:148-1062(-)|eukprot:CAMPEP_0206242864 /NCGR_PEP_ID=MMETSP0047_2-20121206/17288_1 /ASSEMBLY_ACC=CAM_ASM_000192 /TAXON_ID=195065 /ORGANISM="Chroomonas mesostigmatica_cf, Strain CCMP1168" /LENGTH=304 /DNA_ID=CAMNT_0053667919 /DNA_START=72 /DNA_END=986 /DNA_ORIENTATION=+